MSDILDAFPRCAKDCIIPLIPPSCQGPSCICNSQSAILLIACCVYNACDPSTISNIRNLAKAACGVDIPPREECSSTTSVTNRPSRTSTLASSTSQITSTGQTRASVDESGSSSLSTGAIVGITFGIFIVILLVAAALLLYRKHRRRLRDTPTNFPLPQQQKQQDLSSNGGFGGKVELPSTSGSPASIPTPNHPTALTMTPTTAELHAATTPQMAEMNSNTSFCGSCGAQISSPFCPRCGTQRPNVTATYPTGFYEIDGSRH